MISRASRAYKPSICRSKEYYEFGMDDPLGAPPVVRWLIGTLDLAARYGRFLSLELDRIRWPRVMSNTWCRPLIQKFRECHGYLVPVSSCRGPHTVPQMSALLGLWIEEPQVSFRE